MKIRPFVLEAAAVAENAGLGVFERTYDRVLGVADASVGRPTTFSWPATPAATRPGGTPSGASATQRSSIRTATPSTCSPR